MQTAPHERCADLNSQMHEERLLASPESIAQVAVLAGRTDFGNIHSGIVYRLPDAGLFFLHQAWRFALTNEEMHETAGYQVDQMACYCCAVPMVDEIRAKVLVARCRQIVRRQADNQFPYSFRYNPGATIEPRGTIVLSKDGVGFNCSNFVLLVFESVGIKLVQWDTWRSRPDDAVFHKQLLKLLERSSAPSSEVEAVRAETGCNRVRPEEVCGCLHQDLPISFQDACLTGKFVLNVLNAST